MIRYKPDTAGGTISTWAKKAIRAAYWHDQRIEFEFNEIVVIVSPNSCVDDIVCIYFLKHELSSLSKR